MTSNGSKKLDLRWCWKAALCVLFLSMSTTVQAQRVALRYTNRTSAHINVLEQDSQGLTRRVKHLGPGESFRYQGLGEPQFEMLNGVVTRVVEEKRWGGKFVPVGIALVDFPITDYLNASTQLINRSSSPLEVTYVKRTKFRLDQGVVIYSKRVPENGTLELNKDDKIRSIAISENLSVSRNPQGGIEFKPMQGGAAGPAPMPPGDNPQGLRRTVYVNQTNQAVRLSFKVMMGGGRTTTVNQRDLQPGGTYSALPGQEPFKVELANGGNLEQQTRDQVGANHNTIFLVQVGTVAPPIPSPIVIAPVAKMDVQGDWYEIAADRPVAVIKVAQNMTMTRTTLVSKVVSTGSIDAAAAKLTIRTSSGREGSYRFKLSTDKTKLEFVDPQGNKIPRVHWERGR